jgi:hypothetical protein
MASKIGIAAYLFIVAAVSVPAIVVAQQKLSEGKVGPLIPTAQLTMYRLVMLLSAVAIVGVSWFVNARGMPIGIRNRAHPTDLYTQQSTAEEILKYCLGMTLSLWMGWGMIATLGWGLTAISRSCADFAAFTGLSAIAAVVLHPTAQMWIWWLERGSVVLAESPPHRSGLSDASGR